jgi:hypothetical protein
MYRDILRSIVGIEIFPVVSLCLFVAVFAVVLVWTSRLDGAWLARSAGLPLEPDRHDPSEGTSDVERGAR